MVIAAVWKIVETGSIPVGHTRANRYLVLMHGISTVVSDDGCYRNFQEFMGAVAGYGWSLQDCWLEGFNSLGFHQTMESNAGGMVRRLALKTRFSEMGWGSTPLLSAKFRMLPAIKKTFIGKKQNSILLYYTLFAKLVRHRILIPTFGGSSPSRGASFRIVTANNTHVNGSQFDF